MNDDNKKPEEDDAIPPMPTTLPGEDSEVTEIDIAPTSDISTSVLADDEDSTIPPMPTTLPEEDSDDDEDDDNDDEEDDNEDDDEKEEDNSGSDDIPSTWIEIVDGKFKCSECENEVEPETNTIEGVVKADLDQIKADLTLYPTKVVYGICSVCGMEFVFRQKNNKLFLEPSDLEK